MRSETTVTRESVVRPGRLQEVSAALGELLHQIELCGGEITDDDVMNSLDALEGELEDKLEAIALAVQENDDAAEVAKQRAKQLTARAQSFEKAAERLKAYAIQCMDLAGLKRVKTPLVTVYPQTSGQPRIRWPGAPESIPPGFRKVETVVKLDYERALEAYRADRLPEGFEASKSRFLMIK